MSVYHQKRHFLSIKSYFEPVIFYGKDAQILILLTKIFSIQRALKHYFLINFDNFMPLFHYLQEINEVPGSFNKF